MYPETNPLGIGFMGGAASILAGAIAYFVKLKNLELQLSTLSFAGAPADEETDDHQDDDDEYEPRFDHTNHSHSEGPRREQKESRAWFEVLGVSAEASTGRNQGRPSKCNKQCTRPGFGFRASVS
jgi:hypothetical protein